MVPKRLIIISAALTFVVFASMSAYFINEWTNAKDTFMLMGVTALLILLFTYGVTLAKFWSKLDRTLRENSRNTNALTSRIQSLHKKLDTLSDYAGSNLRLARRIPGVAEDLQSLDERLALGENLTANAKLDADSGPMLDEQNSTLSYFSPLSVRSIPIKDKPSSHIPGRLAAAQYGETPSAEKYRALIGDAGGPAERHVCLVGGTGIVHAIEPKATTRILYPHFGLEQIDRNAGYLIVDESDIQSGPWAGVFDAQATGTLRKLLDIIKQAKKMRMVVVLLIPASVNHNSVLIRSLADIVIGANGLLEELPWGNDLGLPVLDTCIEYRRRQ